MIFSPLRRGLVRATLLSLIATALTALALAQQAFNPQDTIPFDSAVRTGSLSNGMHFFIRQNERPAKRVSLRLVVKAGSLYEADDQQGLAHFIEHMAFNGSAHYKPGELVSYFESIGARLGPHLNAYTGFDETVYMFELPTDQPAIVDKGITALADFAGGLSFLPEEIEKERGVVIEEWRGRLGAGSRLRDKQVPLLYFHSRYADRIPIGKPEIIRSAPVARLRAFYDTWYRPERMAVIAVGDIDSAQIETAIRAAFEPLRARAAADPPPSQDVPLHQEFLVSIASDPEITQTTVSVVHKRPSEGSTLVGDYRRSLVERLFEQMFEARLSEQARKPDAGFLAAGIGGGSLGPKVDTFSVSARAFDGRMPEALTALRTEVRRVLEFGFTSSELDRAKRSLTALYERAYSERDKTESGSFAQEYVNYVLEDEPSPGISYEYRLVQQVVPAITLTEVMELARGRLGAGSRVMLAASPEKAGQRQPTEPELLAALAAAENTAVGPWNDTSKTRALMVNQPKPGRVTERRDLPSLGVTVVRFSNGLEAWLKPTDFKNDQVLFSMYSLGGTSLVAPADFLNASLSASFVSRSGVDGLTAVDLQKLLAGKTASASPSMALSTHGFSGSSSPAELETALQLLYQEYTAPGDDPDAFSLMKRQLNSAVANRGQSPGQVFAECLEQLNTSNHYTSKPLTSDLVAKLDHEKMLALYRARFANASDFTFFIVGSFKTDETIPLLAKYVGALRGKGKRTAGFKDIGIRFPTSVERTRCEKGREPRSQAAISFFADPPPDPMEAEKIAAATTVLQSTLRDILREDLGQTYTVSVSESQPLPQRGAGYVQVSFGSAPENIEAMTDRVLREIRKLQQEGPSADLTDSAKESARRSYETNLRQNAYWLRRLETVHLLRENPNDIVTRPARIDAITPDVLREAFKKYFPMDRYTVATLVPEQTASR